MAEIELFEARFAMAYRRYVAEIPTEVDALAVARRAARARPRFAASLRPGLPVWPAGLVPRRLAIVLLVGLLIAALTAIGLLAGSHPSEAPVIPSPSATAVVSITSGPPIVLTDEPMPQPHGAGSSLDIFAVSSDEAYVVAGDERTELWHFSGGWWEHLEPPAGTIYRIAALPGGGLAAVTANGLVVRGPGGWTATPLTGAVGWVAAAPDGSIWTVHDAVHEVVQLRLVDGSWRELNRAPCPAGGWFLALTSDGAVWTAGIHYSDTGGVARYDGQTCVEMNGPDGNPFGEVVGLAAGPSGELAVAAFVPRANPDDGDRLALAVYDGATWTTLKVATLSGWGGRVGFDTIGNLWVSGMPAGLVRWHHAAGSWVEAPTNLTTDVDRLMSSSLAPDGTFWYVNASGAVRRARP